MLTVTAVAPSDVMLLTVLPQPTMMLPSTSVEDVVLPLTVLSHGLPFKEFLLQSAPGTSIQSTSSLMRNVARAIVDPAALAHIRGTLMMPPAQDRPT